MNNSDPQQLNAKYRVMLILWFALVSCVGIYYVLSLVMQHPPGNDGRSRIITFVLTAFGTFMTLVSVALRQKFVAQAESKQQPALVQTGLIVGMALCEAAALLGFLDRQVTGNRYYFVLFVVALVGMIFHFPRRNDLMRASYRITGN